MCILLCITLVIYLNQTALETIVTPFTKMMFKWNDIDNSILFSAAGIEIILVYAIVRFLSTFMKDRTLLLVGFILMISSLVIGIVFLSIPERNSKKSFVAFVLFVALDLIGLPVLAVCSTSLFTKMTKKKYQGVAQGIQRFFLGLGTIFGPLLAGPLINHVYVLLEILLVLSAVLFGFTFLFYDHLEPSRLFKR
jgi:Na+/melibiose symporter-like transporter